MRLHLGTPRANPVRVQIVFAIGVLVLASYVAVLWLAPTGISPHEVSYGSAGTSPRHVAVYLEPIAIDPLNDTMQFRLTPSPSSGLAGRIPESASADISISVSQSSVTRILAARADEVMTPSVFNVDFTAGDFRNYPFDTYHGTLRLHAVEGAAGATGPTLPLRATFWDGLYGYRVSLTQQGADPDGALELALEVRRGGAFIFFAVIVYAAMAIMAITAAAIGVKTFLAYHSPESTFAGTLVGLIFSVVLIRNVLPGAPPLGVRPDMLVFLWSIIVTVLSTVLFVYTWVREGHRA